MPVTKKTHSLIIQLIKEGITEDDQILSDSTLPVKDLGGAGKLYYSQSPTTPPKWGKLFEGQELGLLNSNSSGVYITRAGARVFVLTFGPRGRHLIKKGITEERFGLLVTLNSVKKDSLRSVDITTLESDGFQTKIQSAKPNDPENFGFDIERDLVKCVTGESKDATKYGKILTGKDSLKASIKCDLTTVRSHLESFLERFQSDDYKEDFGWIDKLTEEKRPGKITELEEKLLLEINKSSPEKLWLTIPEIIDWNDHGGFSYKNSSDELYEDLSVEDFKENAPDSTIIMDHLKNTNIYLYGTETDFSKEHWKTYDCVYAEIHNATENETYFLSGGKWYKVDDDLVTDVKDYYDSAQLLTGLITPDYTTAHADEAGYNDDISNQNSALLLDTQTIQIQGRSKFEFCDVYTSDRKIIHIKRYSGSSVLSHLFNQGFVSAQLFYDQGIREKINNELLTTGFQISDLSIRPNDSSSGKYSVVFGIIKRGTESRPEIPFFSKLTYMHISKHLINLGYDVYLLKILDTTPSKKRRSTESSNEEES